MVAEIKGSTVYPASLKMVESPGFLSQGPATWLKGSRILQTGEHPALCSQTFQVPRTFSIKIQGKQALPWDPIRMSMDVSNSLIIISNPDDF